MLHAHALNPCLPLLQIACLHILQKNNDWDLALFFQPFFLLLGRCRRAVEEEKYLPEWKKKRNKIVFLRFFLYIFYFKEESRPICMD